MKKEGRRKIRQWLVTGAFALLGMLGIGGCKTTQKAKTPPEKPMIPRRDTIRPPYGEVIAMYGTPYRRYEEKREVPEIPDTPSEQL